MQARLSSGNMHVCSGSHNDEGGFKHGSPVVTCMYVVGHIMMREGASTALQW